MSFDSAVSATRLDDSNNSTTRVERAARKNQVVFTQCLLRAKKTTFLKMLGHILTHFVFAPITWLLMDNRCQNREFLSQQQKPVLVCPVERTRTAHCWPCCWFNETCRNAFLKNKFACIHLLLLTSIITITIIIIIRTILMSIYCSSTISIYHPIDCQMIDGH